jgi:hypothetical protein
MHEEETATVWIRASEVVLLERRRALTVAVTKKIR